MCDFHQNNPKNVAKTRVVCLLKHPTLNSIELACHSEQARQQRDLVTSNVRQVQQGSGLYYLRWGGLLFLNREFVDLSKLI
mgnify:CR=1 FL=1